MEFNISPIIAAVRTREKFNLAVECPKINTVFLLNSDILTIKDYVDISHKNGKKLFVHFEFADGIGKDSSGVKFIADLGVDGIISTRSNIIKLAKDNNLMTVQRIFVIDSQSFLTAENTVKASKPTFVEIMPGTLTEQIKELSAKISVPVISGGLITKSDNVNSAISAGAVAVSTSEESLW